MRKIFSRLVLTLVINTLIAVFVTAIGVSPHFADSFIISQCIGLSIFACCMVLMSYWEKLAARQRLIGIFIAMPLGLVFGVWLASLLAHSEKANWQWPMVGHVLLIGLVFGVVVSTIFYLWERTVLLKDEIRVRQIRELEIDKQRIEAQLKMLQAQIEPHFLFNTLANVSSLIEADPPKARALLEHLIHYLCATLSRTRADGATLADEVNLLRDYLDVLKIRIGERLNYAFDIPASLLALPFPPMLLQPLVENAVKHGIEPKIGGGQVSVTAGQEPGKWFIEVRDNGMGFVDASGGGTGLSNVRERLLALYGSEAVLIVSENEAGGVTSRLELPCAP